MILCSKISSMTEGAVDRAHMVLGDDGQTLGQLGDADLAKKAELELHEKMETMVAEKGVDYIDAFRAVSNDPKNAAIVQCYAGLTIDKHDQDAEPEMSSQEAGLEIASRVRSYMFDRHTDYATAYRAVLGADSVLRASYGQV